MTQDRAKHKTGTPQHPCHLHCLGGKHTFHKPLNPASLLQVDLEGALRAVNVREFDAALVVPAYGFQDLEAYYAVQSSRQMLKVNEGGQAGGALRGMASVQ